MDPEPKLRRKRCIVRVCVCVCASELCQWWAIVLQFDTTPSSFSNGLIVVSRLMAVWCPMAFMAITRLMVAGGGRPSSIQLSRFGGTTSMKPRTVSEDALQHNFTLKYNM